MVQSQYNQLLFRIAQYQFSTVWPFRKIDWLQLPPSVIKGGWLRNPLEMDAYTIWLFNIAMENHHV